MCLEILFCFNIAVLPFFFIFACTHYFFNSDLKAKGRFLSVNQLPPNLLLLLLAPLSVCLTSQFCKSALCDVTVGTEADPRLVTTPPATPS